MLNEDEQTHISSPRSWLWSDCKLVLRRTNPDNPSEESYENLEAEVQLECQQIPEPFIPILNFDKGLMNDSTTGYFWRKGTPLPTLTVKLQQSYFQLLKQDQDLVMIYCELTFAYPSRKQTHFYLQEIKSIGETKKVFSENGLVQFKDILLKQCSQQKGNNKFSLLIKICATSMEENRIILKTLISTAFYVFNSRIKRKNRNSKLTMKLISPKKFAKPLNDLRMLDQNFSKENVLNFLRFCNKNARILSLTHPLYLIYHYSQVLKLYYNSKQVTNLYELLQSIAPGVNDQDKFLNLRNSFVTYELKKTKKIKKNKRNQDGKAKHIQKLVIKTQIKPGNTQQKKLLLVTFKQDLIDKINRTIAVQKIQNQISLFQKQLQKQIQALTKIFDQWTGFLIEIDLLKQDLESVYWKDIEKEKVLQAYSKHYQMTKNRLITPENKTVNMIEEEQNPEGQSF